MSKEEIVAFLNDVIDALTWKRFALLALLGTLSVTLLMVFENRTTLFNRVIDSTPVEQIAAPWEVSEATKNEILSFSKHPNVGAVLLTEVNLKKNRRETKFWHVNDPVIRAQVAQIMANMLPQPFFDSDKTNNDQMLAVLSNQFVCSPTKDSVFTRFIPTIDKTFPHLCRLAVPPFTGEFAGMITVLLTKTPTSNDVEALKIQITQISVEMYLRDIQRKRK